MKMFLFAAALTLSGAAVAQDTQPATPDQTMPPASSAPDESTPPSAPTDEGMSTMTPAPADQGMTGTEPAAADQTPPPATTPPESAPSAENYPPCSRTVTDKCVNQSAAHKMRHRRKR